LNGGERHLSFQKTVLSSWHCHICIKELSDYEVLRQSFQYVLSFYIKDVRVLLQLNINIFVTQNINRPFSSAKVCSTRMNEIQSDQSHVIPAIDAPKNVIGRKAPVVPSLAKFW
jgi:hypothetical protein